jgi:hypothetical protein
MRLLKNTKKPLLSMKKTDSICIPLFSLFGREPWVTVLRSSGCWFMIPAAKFPNQHAVSFSKNSSGRTILISFSESSFCQ